jgi:TRAP-type C4-dicarboxylate transport system permease large subunit
VHGGRHRDGHDATILILTPVLMPVIKQAGIDPVYFGVLFIINNSIGPGHAAVGHGAQRGGRRRAHEDGRRTKGVLPFMLAEFSRHVPDGAVPVAGHGPAKWFSG